MQNTSENTRIGRKPMFNKSPPPVLTVAVLLFAGLFSTQASATGLERLQAFIAQLTTFQAGFVQTLYDEDANPVTESKGLLF